jgi:hypothetical protein
VPDRVFVRPRESVTTAVTVTVPDTWNTGAVHDTEVAPDATWTVPEPPADVWNATWTGVEPDAPAKPLTVAFVWLCPRTDTPHPEGTELSTRANANDPAGTAVAGALTVNTVSLDPIRVAPENVSTTIRPAADSASGNNGASAAGIVHPVEVPTPVATVPDCPKNSYFTVCVNVDTARAMLIVTCEPAAPATGATVEARGIVAGANDPDTDAVPTPEFFP